MARSFDPSKSTAALVTSTIRRPTPGTPGSRRARSQGSPTRGRCRVSSSRRHHPHRGSARTTVPRRRRQVDPRQDLEPVRRRHLRHPHELRVGLRPGIHEPREQVIGDRHQRRRRRHRPRPTRSIHPDPAPAANRFPSVKSGSATTVPDARQDRRPIDLPGERRRPVSGIPTDATAEPENTDVVPAVVTVDPNWVHDTAVCRGCRRSTCRTAPPGSAPRPRPTWFAPTGSRRRQRPPPRSSPWSGIDPRVPAVDHAMRRTPWSTGPARENWPNRLLPLATRVESVAGVQSPTPDTAGPGPR